jgi:2-C-methyl-D-erythritol 4-phosphate cytidylyltransferase
MSGKITAIVPAAGIGRRFDDSRRKSFFPINGKPLLVHTLSRLGKEALISDIILVVNEEFQSEASDILEESGVSGTCRIIKGGRERQDSVFNALKYIKDEMNNVVDDSYIMVHDGARPYIPDGLISRLVAALQDADGAVPGIPARDTMKTIDEQGYVDSTLDRDRIRAIQTPQIFKYRVIIDAYEVAYQSGYAGTDDAALVERNGGRVRVIDGDPLNIKITTMEDIAIMRCILREEARG